MWQTQLPIVNHIQVVTIHFWSYGWGFPQCPEILSLVSSSFTKPWTHDIIMKYLQIVHVHTFSIGLSNKQIVFQGFKIDVQWFWWIHYGGFWCLWMSLFRLGQLDITCSPGRWQKPWRFCFSESHSTPSLLRKRWRGVLGRRGWLQQCFGIWCPDTSLSRSQAARSDT